jgi:putative transposase
MSTDREDSPQTPTRSILDSKATHNPDREIDTDEQAPIIPTTLSPEAQLKLEIIEGLLVAPNKKLYAARIKEAAVKLGKSERTIRRLVKNWEQEGLVGLTRSGRTDKGKYRVDKDWQDFILKTYKEGNKGSKRMTPQQVAIRVETRADELNVKAPSHMTVYRILNPIIERQEQAKSIRSSGWKGDRLSVKTRDGKDLQIEYSNQVRLYRVNGYDSARGGD